MRSGVLWEVVRWTECLMQAVFVVQLADWAGSECLHRHLPPEELCQPLPAGRLQFRCECLCAFVSSGVCVPPLACVLIVVGVCASISLGL